MTYANNSSRKIIDILFGYVQGVLYLCNVLIKYLTLMTLLEIIDRLAQIMNVSIHHFDHMKFPKDYFGSIKGSPIVVAYPANYCGFAFAIMDDLTIVTATSSLMESIERLKEQLGEDFPRVPEKLERLNLDQIRQAEKFLRENDVSPLTQFDPKTLTYYFS